MRLTVLLLAATVLPGQDSAARKIAALDRRLADELRTRTTPIESASLQAFIDGLSARLAAHLPKSDTSFALTVVTDALCPPTYEPASLPGGSIFVPAALFTKAQDEAEFAGVLAHAMAHIALRHGIREAPGATRVNHSGIPLIFMGNWTGFCATGLALPEAFAAEQRRADMEADRYAVRALAGAGFDAAALARYLERFPPALREARLDALRGEAAALMPSAMLVVSSGLFVAAREEVVRATTPRPSRREPPSLVLR